MRNLSSYKVQLVKVRKFNRGGQGKGAEGLGGQTIVALPVDRKDLAGHDKQTGSEESNDKCRGVMVLPCWKVDKTAGAGGLQTVQMRSS
jgi:hypothetical protein